MKACADKKNVSNDEPLSPRYSACAAASWAAEIERLKKQSVEARIRAALDMKRRFSRLHPAPKGT